MSSVPAAPARWVIRPHDVQAAESVAVLRAYYRDIVDRYFLVRHGRPATTTEWATALADEPSDDLTPPHGRFLLAHGAGRTAGCVGVRVLDPLTTELTRLFVLPDHRGRGLGARLLSAAEDAARELGATRMRLDTRADLVEARSLYTSRGFREIPAYSLAPYSDHWFEKNLARPGTAPGRGQSSRS
ncbi:GNAT family N-acetyltransferase [Actinoalloteichus spitiensis]|uniref:GNAT family N-acetyltransferase n=1 Tax=Actinoalloteichus spitiensis TaxID=252394 RepID=UPI0003632432|nr:GNAT family N-acetyltransferase [Actinoalloteichus spitiensis]